MGAYDAFAARFPYQETDDQLKAIADTIGVPIPPFVKADENEPGVLVS